MKKMLVFLLLVTLFCCGCGNAGSDQYGSPRLSNYNLESFNNGSEDSQYACVSLVFDRSVDVKGNPGDVLRATIGGNRIKSSDMNWFIEEDDNRIVTVQIKITSAAVNGKLVITPLKETEGLTGIIELENRFRAIPFTITGLIPNGVELLTISSQTGDGATPAQVVKEVSGEWHIRSISWIQLLENGQVVGSNLKISPEILDGAIAVHGHDFLNANSSEIAYDISSTLTSHFGDNYIFQSNGSQIVAEKKTPDAETNLDLQIYLYKNFELYGY